MVAGGHGLARTAAGEVVFLEGVLPNEVVRASVAPGHGGVARGAVLEVVEAASGRVTPPCPHAQVCGGCDWLHIDLAAGLQLKDAVLHESMLRAGIDAAKIPQTIRHPSPEGLAARARVRLHMAKDGSVGYLRARSHRVVAVEDCLVLTPPLAAVLPRLTSIGRQAPPGPVRQLLVQCDDDSRIVVTLLAADGSEAQRHWPQAKALRRVFKRAGIECAGGEATGKPLRFTGQPIDTIVPPPSFVQANVAVNRLMVAELLRCAQSLTDEGGSPRVALDLFSGSGNFGLSLAQQGWRVRGFESDGRAVRFANQRATELGLDARFVEHNLRTPPHDVAEGIDLAILDPPRQGAKELLPWLVGVTPRFVAHFGCEVSTFARDAATLMEGGYQLRELHCFDMFPGTHHVEVLAFWARSESHS